LYRCVDDYNRLKTDKQCVSGRDDVLKNISVTESVDHNMTSANTVVDYFRKSIYFGSLPDDRLIRVLDVTN
jgi:hypothetical protein